VLRTLLLVVAVALLVLAVLRTAGDVSNGEGAICGSAWRSAHRQVIHGGDRTPAQRDAEADACEAAGDRALRQAALAGGAGLVLLLGLAVAPVRARRPQLMSPGGGGR
jgi:hypothetical protein